MTATIHLGDCRQILATFDDNSIDSIVTDPPYELGFMGKKWDASGIAYDIELWRECLRVLKPGGHLLAFGGTRTYHRMAVAIEDAGFEIRDSIHWLYGSGFPKSLDVSKAIDKQRHNRADIYKVTEWVRAARDASGITNRDIDAAFGANGMGRHWTDVPPNGKQPAVPTLDHVPTLLDVLGVTADEVPDDIRRLLWDLNGHAGEPGKNWAKREVVGSTDATTLEVAPGEARDRPPVVLDVTAPATDAAGQWEGWGTALKPAHEPIVVARKPLTGTVAANVLEHGTGALNIDGCRVGSDPMVREAGPAGIPSGQNNYVGTTKERPHLERSVATGRWPANLVLTHAAECSDQCVPGCPVAELNAQSGDLRPATSRTERANRSPFSSGTSVLKHHEVYQDGGGGASRFFTTTEWDPIADTAPFRYVAKPSRRERNAGLDGLPEQTVLVGVAGHKINPITGKSVVDVPRANHHPTVKPVALMRWLVRLVTPPGGTVLDPFTGSGTTGIAATLEGFDFIGCELTDDYLPIIEGRIAWAEEQIRPDPESLFNQ